MTPSRNLLLVLAGILACSSCQLPLSGKATGRLEVRNPYAPTQVRKAGEPLVAFPQTVLSSLDHYLLKVLTVDGDPIADLPDKTITPDSLVFLVDPIPAGDYKLVVEAWSAGPVKTAESSQLITVTAGMVTTIDTLTLVPLTSGGDGTFNFSVSIASGFGDLSTAGRLSASLSRLNYTAGSLSGAPTLLDKSLFNFTASASTLGFATTSTLPAGNYLITLERASVSLAGPGPVPVVGIVVQVFPGQVSTIGSAALSDTWLDSAPATPPQGVRVEMDSLATIYVSWDAPLDHLTTAFYQIGYAADEAAVAPDAALSLVSGSGDSVNASMVERVGDRIRVKVTSTTPPFNLGDTQVALFIRSVAGMSTPTAWTPFVFDPTILARSRPIPALVFYDLKPGFDYELQKRASNNSVLSSFDLSVAATTPTSAPAGTTFTFPGLTVGSGESLVLVLHLPDGTVEETPIAFDAINDMDGGVAYDPTAPYYAYPATRDPAGTPSNTWLLLEDPDFSTGGTKALDPPPTVTLVDSEGVSMSWTAAPLGAPHLMRAGWMPETDSGNHPEQQVLGANATDFTLVADWAPESGKLTHYRVRAVYENTFNFQAFQILGPPSGWAVYDLESPALTLTSWSPGAPGTITDITTLSVDYRYTDFQTVDDTPLAVIVELFEWGNPSPLATSRTDVDATPFVTNNGVTTWSPPGSWSGVTFTPGQSYKLRIVAADTNNNETAIGLALKGGL